MMNGGFLWRGGYLHGRVSEQWGETFYTIYFQFGLNAFYNIYAFLLVHKRPAILILRLLNSTHSRLRFMMFLMSRMNIRIFANFQGPAEMASSPARQCLPPLNFHSIWFMPIVWALIRICIHSFSHRFMVHKAHYGHGSPYTFLLKTERLMFIGWMDGWINGWIGGKEGKENKITRRIY